MVFMVEELQACRDITYNFKPAKPSNVPQLVVLTES